MLNPLVLQEDADNIRCAWGSDGDTVIDLCRNTGKFNGGFDDFLDHCYQSGGNWSALLLSGIKALWPDIYDAIPENMGKNSFFTLAAVLRLCGVDTTK